MTTAYLFSYYINNNSDKNRPSQLLQSKNKKNTYISVSA